MNVMDNCNCVVFWMLFNQAGMSTELLNYKLIVRKQIGLNIFHTSIFTFMMFYYDSLIKRVACGIYI